MDERYYARRPHQYGDTQLDRGQIIERLGGYRNDEKLVRLGYLAPVPDGDVCQCAVCGAVFIDAGSRQGHGDDRHRRGSIDERIARRVDHLRGEGYTLEDARQMASREIMREEDVRETQQADRVNRIAPLYLEKTLASTRG